jgi:uncharacterized protein
MTVYLDSSALVKLIIDEPETDELRAYLAGRDLASTMIARTELLRAVARRSPARLSAADDLLDEMLLLLVDWEIANTAARLEPASVRALDAIHVAGALRLEHGLEALVTYDKRMIDAGRAAGLVVSSPGDEGA